MKNKGMKLPAALLAFMLAALIIPVTVGALSLCLLLPTPPTDSPASSLKGRCLAGISELANTQWLSNIWNHLGSAEKNANENNEMVEIFVDANLHTTLERMEPLFQVEGVREIGFGYKTGFYNKKNSFKVIVTKKALPLVEAYLQRIKSGEKIDWKAEGVGVSLVES